MTVSNQLLSASLLFALFFVSTNAWRTEVKQPKGFILASNNFGIDLLNQISVNNELKSKKENIFYSPYSVAFTLAALYQGSGGNTSKQLESALGYELANLEVDKVIFAPQIKNYSRQFFDPEDSNISSNALQTGTALLSDLKFEVLSSYEKNLRDNYDAQLFKVDFASNPQNTQNLINDWSSKKTFGKIPILLPGPPDQSTKLAILNAIYFKGTWKLKFNASLTEPKPFYGANGEVFEKVPFLSKKDYFNVGSLVEINSDLIELPYVGDELSFFAILPKDRNSSSLKYIKKALNPWYIESAISRLYSQEIDLKIPKLAFKAEYQLVELLKKLGIIDVFTPNSDLSGISADLKLSVDEVKHVASLELNEEGSEAAASTYIGIVALSLPVNTPTYVLDHPFLFFIRHKNGQILFIGEVNQF